MAYQIDESGNVVWVGPGPDPGIQLPRSLGQATPEQRLGYLESQLGRRDDRPDVPQLPRFAGSLSPAEQEAILRRQYELAGLPFPEPPAPSEARDWERAGAWTTQAAPDVEAPSADVAAALADLFAGTTTEAAGGYRPTFIDTSAAEAMLPLEATPQEVAALEQLLADLEGRAAAGIEAVRAGWDSVRQFNTAAAERARQLAADAGPRAAQLWIDAANNALTLSRQAGEALANFAGMQQVNISPTAGVQNIAALIAAQAPRAQALAERLGVISAEDIAAQGRTAAMMGEAYAADVTRQALIMANDARVAHNNRVMDRVAKNQATIANMRFQAGVTNAQIANQAAQFAASQVATAGTPAARRQQVLDLAADIEALGTMGESGIALLAQAYGFDTETARRLIEDTKAGIIDWTTESGIAAATARAAGNP